MRIARHPILGDLEPARLVTITVDGQKISAREGEPIAAVLLATGRRYFRRTPRLKGYRGLFCAIGRCTDCVMTVDGVPNVRTCVTAVRDGMIITSNCQGGEDRG